MRKFSKNPGAKTHQISDLTRVICNTNRISVVFRENKIRLIRKIGANSVQNLLQNEASVAV